MRSVFQCAWNSKIRGGADRVAYYLSKYATGYKSMYGYHGNLYKARDYDVIANHTFVKKVVEFAKSKRKKLVSIVHATPMDVKYYPSQGYALRSSDKVVTINSWLRDFVLGVYGIDDDKVVVINNGSPMHLFKSSPAKVRDYYIVGYHGRISSDKGIDKLIKAVEFLNEDIGVNVVLKLLGWQNMKIPRKPYIVVSHPIIDEKLIAQWIDGIDLEVIPTKSDQQPLSVIDALLRGKRVLLTKLDSLEEFNGFVEWIEPDIDYKKLGLEIYRVLKSYKGYDGELQKKAVKKFGIERMVREYGEVFNEV